MTIAEPNTTRAHHDLPDLSTLDAAAKLWSANTHEGVAARLRLARALTNAEPARAMVVATEAAEAAPGGSDGAPSSEVPRSEVPSEARSEASVVRDWGRGAEGERG